MVAILRIRKNKALPFVKKKKKHGFSPLGADSLAMGTRLKTSKSRVMSTRVKLQLKHSRLRCCFCSVSSWEDSYQR